MANLLTMFKGLLPNEPLMVGTVQASSGDNHQVQLMSGGIMIVRGKAAPGNQVFIKGEVIQGVAPNLTPLTIEI